MWTFGGLNTGLNSKRQDSKSILTPSYGANFERQSFTSLKTIESGSITLTKDKYLEFKEFYKNTKQGQNKFTYNDCRFGDRQASFYGSWSATERSGYWIINLSLILDHANMNITTLYAYNGKLATYNDVLAQAEANYEL